MIDTGARNNAIAKTFANNYEKITNYKIVTVNDKKIQIEGKTKINVKIGGYIFELTALVVEDMPAELILVN